MELREHPMPRSRNIAPYFAAAGKIFHLDFDEESVARWRQAIYLTKSIDSTIDESSELFDASSEREIIEGFLNEEYLDEHFPLLSPSDSQERFNHLLDIAHDIFALNRRIRVTPYAAEYTFLRKKEGALYAQLLLECSSEAVRSQDTFNAFARNFVLLGEAGNLIDSCFDVKKDYRRGEIQIDFSLRQRAELLIHSGMIATELSRESLHPTSVLTLGKTALFVLADSLKARG